MADSKTEIKRLMHWDEEDAFERGLIFYYHGIDSLIR
jgi:hypothetical protein